MNPIVVRCASGVVLFLPASRPSSPMLQMLCLTDGTVIIEKDSSVASVEAMLAAMLAKAVALHGAVSEVVQLQLRPT